MGEIETAERLLAASWGGSVRLGEAQTLRKDRCFRFPISEGPEGCPASVIVKQAVGRDGAVIDLDSQELNPSHYLFDEWASMRFTNEVAPGQKWVPEFYGGDRNACLIVYEDLGEGPSLVEPLMGGDPDRARQALIWHAQAVAGLHNATSGREAEFDRMRRELGPPAHGRQSLGWGDLEVLKSELAEGFVAIDVDLSDEFWSDYETLTRAIGERGPFRALVHNDSCPDNNRVIDGRVRLFDFEVGGYHHRLLDAAYARMSMPHCYLANVVPSEVVREVENAYRAASVATVPEIADDKRFGREMVHACFYWVVSNGTWRLRNHGNDDFTWGIATWRQRVLSRLEALADACDEFAYMPAVAAMARRTTARLREGWTVEPLPLYPAFR